MKELFPNKKGKINLYENDIFALDKTIKELDEIHKCSENVNFSSNFSQANSESCDDESWNSDSYNLSI